MSTLMNQARNRVPRIAEAAVERARLTVVPRTPVRAARVPFVMLVSLLLVGGVAGLLCFNTAMEDRAAALEAKQQSLDMELDALRDPQRVAVRAKEMGMVPPNAPAFIRLSDGKVLGKPSPATTENALRVSPLPTRKPKNLRPTPVVIEVKPAHTVGAAGKARGSHAGTKKSHNGHRQQGSQR